MSALHYYKSPEILINQGMHNLPQLWHSRVVRSSNLTFGGYLAGITLVLSVRSSLFVLCRYCFEHIRTVWLTVDFSASSVGAVCGKLWLVSHTITSRIKSWWYLLTRWWPPTTFRKTNHARPHSRDRFKLSLLLWNALPSKTMIWKSSYVKRTQGITLRRKTKKVPGLREGIKRGRKVAMPQVD